MPKSAVPRPAGLSVARPSEFDPTIGDAICDRLIDGESLRAICDDVTMPAKSTVMKWLASGQHPQFVDQYARAREIAADTDFDDIAHYSRQAAQGVIEPAAATAAINGLKWVAGKKAPKKYGDTQKHEHTGAGGGPIQTVDLSRVSDADLDRLEAILGGSDPGRDQGGESETGG